LPENKIQGVLSSYVELKDMQGERQLLWLASEAGGLKVQHGEMMIMVITPKSPLGRALLGKLAGDAVEITVSGTTRCYEISTVY